MNKESYLSNKSQSYIRLFELYHSIMEHWETVTVIDDLKNDDQINEIYNWIIDNNITDSDEIFIKVMKVGGTYDECFTSEFDEENEARAIMGLPPLTSDE